MAKHIQASMLPGIFPAFPERGEFDIYASMTPAKEVGGDFYDFFFVDEDHLALVMADVSGKGIPAAMFMVIAKTLLKNAVRAGDAPARALEKVNRQLCEKNDAEMFVTVWLGVLELSSGKMLCANAGHEYPVIRRKEGIFELLKIAMGLSWQRWKRHDTGNMRFCSIRGQYLCLYGRCDGKPLIQGIICLAQNGCCRH